jgi:hypothetical protein
VTDVDLNASLSAHGGRGGVKRVSEVTVMPYNDDKPASSSRVGTHTTARFPCDEHHSLMAVVRSAVVLREHHRPNTVACAMQTRSPTALARRGQGPRGTTQAVVTVNSETLQRVQVPSGGMR